MIGSAKFSFDSQLFGVLKKRKREDAIVVLDYEERRLDFALQILFYQDFSNFDARNIRIKLHECHHIFVSALFTNTITNKQLLYVISEIVVPSLNDVPSDEVSSQNPEEAPERRTSCGSEMEIESTHNESRPSDSIDSSGDNFKPHPLTLSVPRDRSQKTPVPDSMAKLIPQTNLQSIPMNLDHFGGTTVHLTTGRHQAGYDIYPGLHNQAGGQFFRVAKRTQLMFPQNEKKVSLSQNIRNYFTKLLFTKGVPSRNMLIDMLIPWEIIRIST
ncbi:unnamed protein product [Trichobilharzia regenti]|nr:unnamed protein product [Trichobilharzia regenti]